jgi:ATPase family associated with various cellular activities (AAA)
MIEQINANSAAWDTEFDWLEQVIETRFDLHLGISTLRRSVYELTPPDLSRTNSALGVAILQMAMGFEERIILALAMSPHLRPQVLDRFFTRNEKYDRTFTEVGGIKGRFHSGFLPTGETAAFLVSGKDISRRIQLIDYFRPEHSFAKLNILKINRKEATEPLLSGALEMTDEFLTFFTTSKNFKPDFASNFPAKLLKTRLSWADLVLDPHVLAEISELSAWIQHQEKIMVDWGLQKHLKRGYRALFYGPPGTGKSLTATLIGKQMGLDVYRIDLSQVVSKYIGETEKNLAAIFDQAENKNWILFFDEADALFGKRSATSDAKDRHANQEVAYLLQRIEDYSGVVVLATNLKANMDIAFTRRFQSIIYFPAPNFEQRLKLWENAFKPGLQLSEDVDFNLIANTYQITGGNIINVLRYCSLAALRRESDTIEMEDIEEGIKRELRKEGKTM